jgi:hypothetical protein
MPLNYTPLERIRDIGIEKEEEGGFGCFLALFKLLE